MSDCDGCSQRPCVCETVVLPTADKDATVLYDMIRERDHYRVRCHAAVERIEREAGKVSKPNGSVEAIYLPVEAWRSIRAMLQQEPRVISPGVGA